jgi:uncharacterized protein
VNGPPGRSPLRVPLERLNRLEPLRKWVVEVDPALVVGDEKDPSVTGDEAWPVSHLGDVRVGTEESVQIDIELDVVTEGVMVSGAVVSHWRGPCARCLTMVSGSSVAEVQELFETQPVEGESYLLGEELLDLAPMVRDAMLLELPSVVRCREGEPCLDADLEGYIDGDEAADDESGPPRLADPRWSALDELRFDESPDETSER